MTGDDELKTSPVDFHHVWSRVANKDAVAATATFGTIGYPPPQQVGESEPNLPRVDQLIRLGEILGVGGNGEVRAAEQTTLHRTIAVKRPRDAGTLTDRLLREARIIGYLEHPGIPPVHFVGVGASEELLVGLKHIEGETFGERLAREAPLENLDQNLEILLQVTNAVGYAHSRGVVHLDIKPDNVMTGRFGEVYVLDWGLATAFDDRAVPELFTAKSGQARGTPAFMAPEMIVGEGLGPATDVYLLGGMLHYLLTHEAPNAGRTALEAMQSAYASTVTREYPDALPAMLVQICQRALAREPADRFPDADTFREALVAYRGARQELDALSVAKRQLAELQLMLRGKKSSPAAAYQMYGAARQSLDEAMRLQTAAESTRPLRQELLEAMIEWELHRDNAAGAELLMSELPDPRPDLLARIRHVTTAQSMAARELDALRTEFDHNIGSRTKALTITAIGLTIALLELGAHVLGVGSSPERVLTGYAIYIAILSALTFASRRTLFGNLSNRAASVAIWLLTLFGLSVRVGAYVGLLTVPTAMAYDLTLVTLVCTMVALLFDRRILVAAPVYLVATIAIFAFTPYATLIFGVAHFIGLTAIGLAVNQGTRATS